MSRKKSLSAASQELIDAEESLSMLVDGITFDNFRKIWSNYLGCLYRCSNKVKASFIGSHKFSTWDGVKQKEIRNDPWLQYLKQARHADEHGLEFISTPIGSSIVLVTSENDVGDDIINELTIIDGKLVSYTGNRPIAELKPTVVLNPVTNYGKIYHPPFYNAVDIKSTIPIEARKALDWYRNYIDEAEKLFL